MKKIVLSFVLLLLAGCANAQTSKTAVSQDHSTCLVCKYNADLACVDIPVEKDTPRYEYKGTMYYFCSEQCKGEFVKDPEKYIARK